MIARFIEEKEQNKLDRRDPKILEQKRNGLLPNSDIKTMVNFELFFTKFQMKDYKTILGQYVRFVEAIEGEIEDNSVFFSKFRLKAFLRMFQVIGKKPNTIANKAKVFCEVIFIIFLNFQSYSNG
jgi:hypothetical protein